MNTQLLETVVGNAAKMRESLTKVKEWMERRIATRGFETSATFPTMLEDVVLPALSAPPRNCDKFVDELDAQIEFLNVVWRISVTKDTMLESDKFENWTEEMKSRYTKWLFAEAKGECDGSK